MTTQKRVALYNDKIFKAIFKENLNVLAKMIADITGIAYELLKDNITLIDNEIPVSKKYGRKRESKKYNQRTFRRNIQNNG